MPLFNVSTRQILFTPSARHGEIAIRLLYFIGYNYDGRRRNARENDKARGRCDSLLQITVPAVVVIEDEIRPDDKRKLSPDRLSNSRTRHAESENTCENTDPANYSVAKIFTGN